MTPVPRLGELLLEMKAIDRFQLEIALGLQQRSRAPLGRIVIDQWFCSGKHVLQALARQVVLPFVELDEQPPPPAVVSLLPRKVAFAHRAVPFAVESGVRQRIRVAVAAPGKPMDVSSLQTELEAAARRDVRLFLALDESVERALESWYPNAAQPGSLEILIAGWAGEKAQALLDAMLAAGLQARPARGLEVMSSTAEQVLVCPLPYLLSLTGFRRPPSASLVVWVDSVADAKQALASKGVHGYVVEGRDAPTFARALTRICDELRGLRS